MPFRSAKHKKLKLVVMIMLFMGYAFASDGRNQDYIHDSIRMTRCIDSVRSFFHSDYSRAYSLALKALSDYKNTSYVYGKIRLLQVLAEISYYYKSSFDSSLIYLNRMRELSDNIGLARGEAWYKLNLGNIYYYQNDYNKAMRLYNQSKTEAETINDRVIIADALTGIADILMQWGDYENSLKNLNEALDYALSSNSLMGQFLLYDDIANIYKLTEKYDSSLIYYEKTLDLAKNIKNTYAILVSNLNVAYLKYKINPSYDIIPILEELQSEAKDNNFVRLYIEIGFTLCEVLQDKGNYRKANVLYQEIFALRDSVIGNEEIRQVAEIESNYEIRKKELENRELMRLNEINSLKLRVRKIVIFFTVFILIQALVLLFIIFRKYKTIKQNLATIKKQEKELLQKEKEGLELQLEYKERERTSIAAKVFQYNQLNQKVIDELASIKKILITDCDQKEVNSKIQSLMNEMGSSLSNHIWKEFETIFTESNPSYLKKLTTQFPNLTTNEIKLCVLLYINLRTKEIASITKQSIKSINVARTRLRKKLHLKHTNANISSFLQQIS